MFVTNSHVQNHNQSANSPLQNVFRRPDKLMACDYSFRLTLSLSLAQHLNPIRNNLAGSLMIHVHVSENAFLGNECEPGTCRWRNSNNSLPISFRQKEGNFFLFLLRTTFFSGFPSERFRFTFLTLDVAWRFRDYDVNLRKIPPPLSPSDHKEHPVLRDENSSTRFYQMMPKKSVRTILVITYRINTSTLRSNFY